MAECPNCHKKLHVWNIKAECPHCHANIPNHNWEARLEEDARERERAFYALYSGLNKLKFAVVGNVLRILRLVFSFLPILGYVVPFGTLHLASEEAGAVVNADPINAIALFTNETFKAQDLLKLVTDGVHQDTDLLAILTFGVVAGSLLFGVLAFFFIPILFRHPRNPVIAVFHAIALGLYAAGPAMFLHFLAAYDAAGYGAISGKTSFGIYIGIALFAVALILDIIVLATPLKETDGKYVPKDELQIEYAKSIGAM